MSEQPMNLDQIIEKSTAMGYGEIHIKLQPEIGLQAFVVIHNTQRGPALGGCRFLEYPSCEAALIDALRLGQGMSYKAAMANLNYGGGKAVLMKPAHLPDRDALFAAFGRFVNELGGRYVTAIDSGSELKDMGVIAKQTPYVSGTSREYTDPSPHTARGVFRTIEAAVKFHFGKKDLKNLHIAIQGMGHVGHTLAALLHERGVKLTITDKDKKLAAEYAQKFDAKLVEADKILEIDCDVFAPCALGNVLNDDTIPLLKTPIVAGAANNQLGEPRHAEVMRQRGILYAPDFVANAGGLIFAVMVYENKPLEKADEHVDKIYDTMLSIFTEAKSHQCSTEVIAEKIAKERLRAGAQDSK